MYDWNWFTPVSLSGEHPVTQLIVYFTVTDSLFLQEILHFLFGFCYFQTIEEVRVDHLTGCHIRKCSLVDINRTLLAFYNLNHRKIKLLCELPVTGIMSRYCHDRTGTIGHQNIIGDPYRNLLAVYRIDCTQTTKDHTCLILCKLSTLKIRLSCCHLTVLLDLIPVCDLILILIDQRMLRRDNHIGCSKQRVWTRCIDTKLLVLILQAKINLSSLRTSDPVLLGNLNLLNIIYIVQILDQLICIFCNL